jgi:hypothetical protein
MTEPSKELTPIQELLRDMDLEEQRRKERQEEQARIRQRRIRYEDPITVPRVSPKY